MENYLAEETRAFALEVAERLAGHVAGVFPDVQVSVHHREEPYWPTRENPDG